MGFINHRLTWTLLLGLALAITPVLTASEKAPETKEAVDGGKFIYVCPDDEAPCIADEEGECDGCGVALQKKEYNLHNHMEVLGKLAPAIKRDISRKAMDDLGPHAAMVKMIAERITEFAPEKNADDLDGYKASATELVNSAEALLNAARSDDVKQLKIGFRGMTSTCSDCHRTYRESD